MESRLPDSKIRDAVMIYVTRILNLGYPELAFITKVIYTETFLVSLLRIRIELGIEEEGFYSLNILEGIEAAPGEDT